MSGAKEVPTKPQNWGDTTFFFKVISALSYGDPVKLSDSPSLPSMYWMGHVSCSLHR